jgi:hypothetical protein
MDILLFSILTNFLYFCSGSIFIKKIKEDFHSQFKVYILGVIFVSFISLLLNFFTALNPNVNSILYLIIFFAFIIKTKFILNKQHLIFLLVSSLITFLLLIYSNVNRPDAGLYHLPYISIINENKIIFGLSNIHFRFGHISILQYLSAINNNYLFLENGISIPLASIVSFFYIYFFYDVWKIISKKEKISLSKYFSLSIVIYIAFKITDYSNFGNDAVAHLSFFYLVSYILTNEIKKINFNFILAIAVFAFINKTTLGFIFIIPIIIFFLQNKFNLKKFFFTIFSPPSLLLYLWLIKNIIISGCAIYPLTITCFKQFSWTNIQKTTDISIESNAWAKGWPDRVEEKNLSMVEFSKNFNWFEAWRQKHLNYILKILIPYVIILFFIIFYIKLNSKNENIYNNKDFKIRFFLSCITSLVGTAFFFFLFPLYRYGYSYVITIIALLFILMIKNNLFNKKNITVFKFFFIICFFLILGKQLFKNFKNSVNTPWPNLYTLDLNGEIYLKKKIKIGENFTYYLADKGDNLCMYSKTICTSYIINNVKYSIKKNYLFLNVKPI